jgi:ABC-2 type transport system ATP-binding protein
MAQTADHLLVIGRGRLLADVSTAEFIDGSGAGTRRSPVFVRSPAGEALERLLLDRGHAVEHSDGGLLVRGATAPEIGDLAAANGFAVHELRSEKASLEAAFMAMTRDSVEVTADAPADGASVEKPS